VAALVQAYIDDPVKAALSDDGKRIRQIAADLDKFIASGHIEVKSADKATASIRRILDGDLDAALAKHLDVCSRIETEQRRIAPLLRQKADAEERIKADRENEARLASEISELEGSLSQKQKALEEKAAQLKSDLDGFPQ
jgi:chromosome segregation ATPase